MEVELFRTFLLLNCICVPVGWGGGHWRFSLNGKGAKLLQDDQ